MNSYPLIREARSIEMDTRDILDSIPEPVPDLRPMINKIVSRVGVLADQLEKLEELDVKTKRDAERWQFLFETPGLRFVKSGGSYKLMLDTIGVDGSVIGCRLLGVGSSKVAVVDRVLGFVK